MRHDLSCEIVQDLLPNFIENLTSDTTNSAVQEHITNCKECSEMLDIFSAEISTKNSAPKKELKFLKKIKLTRLIAVAAIILLSFLLAYMLYSSEYQFTNDQTVLSAAITEYTSHGEHKLGDAYVLETKEIDGVMIAFFKDNNNPNIYGFAKFLEGVNMKYRLVKANFGPSAYSAIVETYRFETNKGSYYAVGGYNLDKKIVSYGFRLYDRNSSNFVENMLNFNVENSQFLEIKREKEIQESIKKLQGNLAFLGHGALLDAEGNDITKSYKIPDNSNTWSSGTGTAELFMLYVYIIIVLALGFVFARYFLSEK